MTEDILSLDPEVIRKRNVAAIIRSIQWLKSEEEKAHSEATRQVIRQGLLASYGYLRKTANGREGR